MEQKIRHWLKDLYGINVQHLEEVPGGWSALAFKARAEEGAFFVKVYDQHRPSVRPWIDRINAYMPVVLWLSRHTPLSERIVAPRLTPNGTYQAEDADHLLMVFPFIEGATLCQSRLSPIQIRQLAETLAELHAYGKDIPVATESLRETYTLPFDAKLESYLRMNAAPSALTGVFTQYADILLSALRVARGLSGVLRAGALPLALCHTDVHGWNLMQAKERLILIDWEGLRLAPPEADLFSFTEGFFFEDAARDFFPIYHALRPEYTIDARAMAFYRLRRRLEDIADFADSMLHDALSPPEYEKSLYHLRKECETLSIMQPEMQAMADPL